MNKLACCLTTAAALLAAGSSAWLIANAGESAPAVTADGPADMTTLITNNSFENYTKSDADKVVNSADGLRGWSVSAPNGWEVTGTTVTTLIIDADCYTDNNFGKATTIADGNVAFYLRMGWENGTTNLTQKIATLPAGKYTLSVMYRTGYANSATSSFALIGGGTRKTVAFDQGSASFMTSAPWKTATVDFNQLSDGACTIGATIDWISGGSCVMFDNFKLTRTGDLTGDEPIEPEPVVSDSPTEGVITHDFVSEADMKDDILQMLADFTVYIKNDFQEASAPNSLGEACGCFKGENTMGANEQGVRPNADLSMICAFLVKYAQGKVTLPQGVTWANLEDMAMKSLVFAYSTHKANKLKTCTNNQYWGSTKVGDSVWESSLWAMSVAYSAFFQWDKLTQAQKDYIQALLVAECEYELGRSIPTGYQGDTKAEENGWEVDILAVTLGLFPNHAKAPQWFERMREFAINSYSHSSDAQNTTVIDPDYNNKTVADLYKGQNLYDDYTLQNHNLFHTSYQNVVMQELGEAALGLQLFQQDLHGNVKWKSNALMHNNQKVMDEVLNWLALSDGELAMPNGNDWSLFLFDQITSYSTMATFLKDPNALFLENMAYKFIQARQKTTTDGSWLLRADVGARRMGVEAHRVMMTWLMHEANSTADLTPVTWPEFRAKYAEPKIFPSQNVIRAISPDRFVCFSWSTALSSYTGYLTSNNPDNNKIIVPYRANNTGNFLGWYDVKSKNKSATPVVAGIYDLGEDYFVMNGELSLNGGCLDNRFVIYATPGNAVIYLDHIFGNAAATIRGEYGGLMAISNDPFTRESRAFYTADNEKGAVLDGKTLTTFETPWLNIDNQLGFITPGHEKMAFGDQANNNSILTSKLYSLYDNEEREVKAGDVVDRRAVVYYTTVDAATTKALSEKAQSLTDKVPAGWNGVIAADPDGTYYILLPNFMSMEPCALTGITTEYGAPVFGQSTAIENNASASTFIAEVNHSYAETLNAFVKGTGLVAMKDPEDANAIYITNNGTDAKPEVTFIVDSKAVKGEADVKGGATVRVSCANGALSVETAEMPVMEDESLTEGYVEVTDYFFGNTSFEEDETYGASGTVKLGSTTYDPAYINEVAPLKSDFPNILPVKNWVNENNMTGKSNYCRMYSMPYSTFRYCVSPANVGNYAAQCAPKVGSTAEVGDRCLTVLNSWSTGDNVISQSATVPAGKYRLLIDAKYECPDQESNDGTTIKAGDNINKSLTGVKYGTTEMYAYPAKANNWETLVYDFDLDDEMPIAIRLGYNNSASKGAATNSLLYIDNVRLYRYGEAGLESVATQEHPLAGNVYNLHGMLVRRAGDTSPLAPGIYIAGNKKYVVK